jgi:hypothetical protein
METFSTVDEAREYIQDSINNWLGVEEKKILQLAAYAKKKRHNIGGPAAQIKALEKNIRSFDLNLKRGIYSDPKILTAINAEIEWSRNEISRLKEVRTAKANSLEP